MTTMTTEREVDGDEFEPPNEPTLIEVVRQIHDDLELPEGFTAQIIKGQLIVMPTPAKKHAFIIRKIDRALIRALPEDEYDCYQEITGEEPEGDRYVPDLGVWPQAVVAQDPEGWLARTADLVLAVEVTSPGGEERDYDKTEGYARAGVPIYLIVDRKRQRCVVFTAPEPAKGRYQTTHVTDFGDPLTIPLETPVQVDTSEF